MARQRTSSCSSTSSYRTLFLLQTFMVWRLPHRGLAEQTGSEWAEPLTDEKMDWVCRGQLASTYQKDYLGIPQGV